MAEVERPVERQASALLNAVDFIGVEVADCWGVVGANVVDDVGVDGFKRMEEEVAENIWN
jgi:hypothetical protein